MKWIKLYEAFENDVISQTINFLYKQLGREKSNTFKSVIVNLMNLYDIQISKIKNENIEYLKSNKAALIKSDGVFKSDINKFGIFCLKFWFSIEDGYLGFSGTGDIKYSEFSDNDYAQEKFDSDEMEIIRNRCVTGNIYPVTNYSTLKTGDDVIFKTGRLDITKGKIFVTGTEVYVIHDNYRSDGSIPSVNGWRDYGEYSWQIVDGRMKLSDHGKLHMYEPSKNPIDYKVFDDNIIKQDTNPSYYNLLIASDGNMINTSADIIMKKSDFCIILYLDDILKQNRGVKSIRKDRKESITGSYKNLSDEELRDININRYLKELIKRMTLNSDDIYNLNNIQKIFKYVLCGKFSLISIINDDPGVNYIRRMLDHILSLIEYNGDEKYQQYLLDSKIIPMYKKLIDDNMKFKLEYDKSYLMCKDSKFESIIEEIVEIGEIISDYFSEINIQNLVDAKIEYYKIISIKNILSDDNCKLSNMSRDIILYFSHSSTDIRYISNFNENDINMEPDLRKLKHIKKYITSLLK